MVAGLEGINDPDAAAALSGWEILIKKTQLPATAKDEYYWVDLIGLAVENLEGVKLGQVESLLETGANDVLVVKQGDTERLIPFIQPQTVRQVDLEHGLILVDWDAEF